MTKRITILAVAFFLAISILPALLRIYPDLLWFEMAGFFSVYTKIIFTKIWLGIVSSLIFASIILGNLYLISRFSPSRFSPTLVDAIPIGGVLDFDLRKVIYGALTLLLVGFSLIFGFVAAENWEILLRYFHSAEEGFKHSDPIFGKSINFYVFHLPLQQAISGILFGLFFLMTIFSAVIYFFHGLILSDRNQLEPPPRVKNHLLALGGLTLLFRAWNYRFLIFDLLYTPDSVVRGGGGFATMHARLPLLKVLMAMATLSGLLFIATIFIKKIRFAIGALGLFFAIGFIGQVYPVFVQKWKVEPSKQELEKKYIEHNINATLQAYNLDRDTVTEKEYPLEDELSHQLVMSEENSGVLKNIRLWDWRPLRRTFRQLQELRTQYDFADVDIDRYKVENQIRQVQLSCRELNILDLPEARNDWFQRTYVYTHGYGVVASPVNETYNGKPKMFVRDIDPINYEKEWNYRFNVDPGPRIYYGERTNHYVITHPNRSEGLEFDYPLSVGQNYAKYSYHGRGGVELSSLWRRFAYALKFNELKFLLPGEIEKSSRLMYHRNIVDRVRKIAPFLRYDRDAYVVVHEGRLVWMLDAYTTTSLYPYSTPMADVLSSTIAERRGRRTARRIIGGERSWGNYIRNPIKVTVDAYDGTVNFYLTENEPIAECYSRIFPGLFKPFSAMPEGLREHIRYPMTMFLMQARTYQDYHMKNPVTFYAGEDRWQIGQEIYDNTERVRTVAPPMPSGALGQRRSEVIPRTVSNVQDVMPYYVVVKVPGEEKAEFVLMLPFTPKNKQNLTAWIAARCDGRNYGQILVYRFPKGKLASGPMQVENFISQEPDISQQISLWNTEGSRVLRGNLLVIPMSRSLLYVEPIYIQSEGKSAIPELRRVVVGYREKVVWGESLEAALLKIFADSIETRDEQISETPTNQTFAQLVAEANRNYSSAIEAQKSGDWAKYGHYLDLLEKTLQKLSRRSN